MNKLPYFLSKIAESSPSSNSSSWPWPPAYCHQPRTLSFSARTLNDSDNVTPTPQSPTFESAGEPGAELVIRGLRSDRLFFKPGETSSILEEAKIKGAKKETRAEFRSAIKESVIMSMDSEDPYADFKKSMEEMVEAHKFKDWESLEELLSCYLKVNARNNHGFIIAAFVDLLVSLAFASSSTTATTTTCCSSGLSPSSPLSYYTSSNFSDDSSSTPCISSLGEEDDDNDIKPK